MANTESQSSAKPTLYQNMSDRLLELIRSGHYPVGSKLPTEMELCEMYGSVGTRRVKPYAS